MSKQRLSVSVDTELVEAAARQLGPSRTLSGYVNDALKLKIEHDRRLGALRDFVAEYEREHGEITESEMRQAARDARSRASSARSLRPAKPSRSGRR